jgi:transcriptional regulator with XRE-family HTH domain
MEQLKRLRTARGLSQAKLAARADLDPSTVNQIERGARDASPATLWKLAQALDVSLAELLEDTGPKGVALPSQATLFNGSEEERRAQQADWVGQAAKALDAEWIKEVTRNKFNVEEYDEAGRALYALDALLADAMTEAFVRDEAEASEPYRAAWHRGFGSVEGLRRTLQRAHDALEARGVSDLNEYRERRAG